MVLEVFPCAPPSSGVAPGAFGEHWASCASRHKSCKRTRPDPHETIEPARELRAPKEVTLGGSRPARRAAQGIPGGDGKPGRLFL